MPNAFIHTAGKWALGAFLTVALGGVLMQAYSFWRMLRSAQAELGDVRARDTALAKENANLESDVVFFANPYNLEKEARLQNWKLKGEELIIVVPANGKNQ
ncbi:MAG: hypothetical protein HYS43_01320 [Candidatus Liptonbacteria bacterium]|nr:hypothetical protein [Candidatus Liptonbacteria bacterium]